ncbi:lipoprotein [Escherichia coli]
MRKIVSAALLALVLSGCATNSPYGNYLTEPARVNQAQLATEAVNQLVELFPPARSRFELQQPTPDAFGQSLVKGLRNSGYAVLELEPKQSSAATTDTNEAPSAGEEPIVSVPSPSQTYPLRYVVDNAGDSNLYRLTLLVGTQSLTRPYLHQNGELLPAGYWVRKE